MFDAKSLLENVFNAGRANAAAEERPPQGAAPQTGRDGQNQPSLEDLLGGLTGGAGGKSFSDVLAQVQSAAGQPGGVVDTLRQVLGQAVEGTKEGAGKIGDAVGAKEILERMSGGKSSDELIAQLKDLAAKNQMTAGAILGGLGALVLGTQTGRSAALGAAKLGALALIGGLAYKAYQNYKAGASPLTGEKQAPSAAPAGSGFEPDAISNDSAALYLRAMIAAAAADGRVDAAERQKILSALPQGGVEEEAAQFLERELARPASADGLAAAVSTPEEAARVYTAARLAVVPDSEAEHTFLAALATKLRIDPALAQQIDQSAKAAG